MATSAPVPARLGHVGLHVTDLERAKQFYRDVVGLRITDEDPQIGMVFLSARPEEEHHELLLCGGRNVPRDAMVVQQVSFRCNSLEDIRRYHERFREHEVPIEYEVHHGNAVAIYFYDPDGNRCEVYWNTGLEARQPYLQRVDLDKPADQIIADIRESVRRYGKQGIVDMSLLEGQELAT
jgi:catechol-2,3-dioxygenase